MPEGIGWESGGMEELGLGAGGICRCFCAGGWVVSGGACSGVSRETLILFAEGRVGHEGVFGVCPGTTDEARLMESESVRLRETRGNESQVPVAMGLAQFETGKP